MEATILPVEAIRERDVDLILLEELSTDLDFCKWFTAELDLPKLQSINGAWRSITGFGLGETDLLFSYIASNGIIFVLIENKLDANFQEEQFERYQKRAAEYLNENRCSEAYSILIAPELYCINQSEFEFFVSYESIVKRFESTGTVRSFFKSKLLKIAFEKLRRGYQPVNSEPVQRFWQDYWDYKQKVYPDLKMKKPGIVPYNSDWPMLYDERLKNVTFHHKLMQGNVDATFRGFPNDLKLKIAAVLPEWAKIETHQYSFSIRVFSGKIDRTKDFLEQVNMVDAGLNNLNKIRNWLLETDIRLDQQETS